MTTTTPPAAPEQLATLPPERLALRPKDASLALGLGRRKLWELTNRGLIPHIKIDRCVLYPVDALREWLAEQTKGGRP